MANKKFSQYSNNPTPEDGSRLLFENQAATDSYNYTFIQFKTLITNLVKSYINTETIKEDLNITTNGQTVFILSNNVDSPNTLRLSYEGIDYSKEGTDYTISGSTLTWLDPDGVTLKAGATFQAFYFYTGT